MRLFEFTGLLQMHGTGTPLGDPIEVGAAVSAYLTSKRQESFTLSSSKSAVGHAEPAAGELTVQIDSLRCIIYMRINSK